MKKTIIKTLASLFMMLTSICQAQISNGVDCPNATLIQLSDSLMVRVNQQNTDGWISFVANSKNPIIKIKNIQQNTSGKITYVYAYKGTCSDLTLIETDTINPLNDSVFVMHLNLLNTGDTVFIYTYNENFPQPCPGGVACPSNAIFDIKINELKSIFYKIKNFGKDDLNPTQLEYYKKIKKQNIHTSIEFISTEDITKVAETGKLKVSMPFLYCNKMKFKVFRSEYIDENNYEWIGKSFIEDDTVCTYANLTLIKIMVYLLVT